MNLDGFTDSQMFVITAVPALDYARGRGINVMPFRPNEFLITKADLLRLTEPITGITLGGVQALDYRDIFLPQLISGGQTLQGQRDPNACTRCNLPRDRCQCERCGDCENFSDECTCDRCEHCGNHNDDCSCERCRRCDARRDDCECERCDNCGALTEDCECQTPTAAVEVAPGGFAAVEGCTCEMCNNARNNVTPVTQVPTAVAAPTPAAPAVPAAPVAASTTSSPPAAVVATPAVPVTPPPPAIPEIAASQNILMSPQWAKLKEAIAEILMPVVNKRVLVWANGGARTSQPGLLCTDSSFDILLFAENLPGHTGHNNTQFATLQIQRDVFGQKIPDTSWMSLRQPVRPWLGGMPIMDGLNEVGAISKFGMVIYFPCTVEDCPASLAQFRQLLTVAVDALKSGATRALSRDKYLKFCEGRVLAEANRLDQDILTQHTELNNLVNQIFSCQRSLKLMESESKSLRSSSEYGSKKYSEEFESIMATLPIVNAQVSGDTMMFDTKELIVVDPRTKKEHLLGRFRIFMPLKQGFVRIFNLDRTVRGMNPGMQAPHVFQDGAPCLGNLEATIASYIARRDILGLLHTILAYLNTVNVDDGAGRYVNNWPVVGQPINPANYGPPVIKE